MLNPAHLPLPALPEPTPRPRAAESARGDAGRTQKAPTKEGASSLSAFPPGPSNESASSAWVGPKTNYSLSHEEISVRYESRDGDVLEFARSATMSRGVTVATAYTRAARAPGHGKDADALSALLPWDGAAEGAKGAEGAGTGQPERGRDWARAIGDELKRQQARLLEAFLKGHGEGRGEGGGRGGAVEERFVMISVTLVAGRAGEADGAGAAVPDYWNAENTSDRIVAFATSFAGIGGEGFAEAITQAVAEGFRQAEGVLDGLQAPASLDAPAAKLRGETKDLVFAKLEKWLEAHQAGAYNQGAQKTETEPALPAA